MLEMRKNAFAAEALPLASLGSLQRSPSFPSWTNGDQRRLSRTVFCMAKSVYTDLSA